MSTSQSLVLTLREHSVLHKAAQILDSVEKLPPPTTHYYKKFFGLKSQPGASCRCLVIHRAQNTGRVKRNGILFLIEFFKEMIKLIKTSNREILNHFILFKRSLQNITLLLT